MTASARSPRRRRHRPGPPHVRIARSGAALAAILLSVLAIRVALAWVFPVYWMVNSSLLLDRDAASRSSRTFFPFGGDVRQLHAACSPTARSSRALGISVAITLIAVFFCLLFAFLAAVAISRFRFRGRTSFVIAMLHHPDAAGRGPVHRAVQDDASSWACSNTVIGVSVIYIAAVVPFTIWMLRGFVAGIPADLEEAAMVDGLSRTQAFMRITFPLLAPGLVASGVFAFLQAWNEFTVALVLLPRRAVPDAAALAARLRAGERDPCDRLGPGHGGLDPRRDPRHRVLPHRPGAHDERTGERGGQGMTRDSDQPCLLPGLRRDGASGSSALPPRLRAGLAGVCLFGENIESREQLRELTDADPCAPIRGRSSRSTRRAATSPASTADEGSPYPGNALLGRIDDLDAHRRGRRDGRPASCVAVGVNLNFAPDVDINSNPDNPVIGVRSFGDDPGPSRRTPPPGSPPTRPRASPSARSTSRGTATPAQDSHLALPVVDVPLETLRDRELVPFARSDRRGRAHDHDLAHRAAAARPLRPRHLLLRHPGGSAARIGSASTASSSPTPSTWRVRAASSAFPPRPCARSRPAATCSASAPDNTDEQLAAIEAALDAAVADGTLPADRLADAAARVASTRAPRVAEPATLADRTASVLRPRPRDRARSRSPTMSSSRRTRKVVVTLETVANIAVGDAPWGLAAARRASTVSGLRGRARAFRSTGGPARSWSARTITGETGLREFIDRDSMPRARRPSWSTWAGRRPTGPTRMSRRSGHPGSSARPFVTWLESQICRRRGDAVRVGIDIGGTKTDAVAIGPDGSLAHSSGCPPASAPKRCSRPRSPRSPS